MGGSHPVVTGRSLRRAAILLGALLIVVQLLAMHSGITTPAHAGVTHSTSSHAEHSMAVPDAGASLATESHHNGALHCAGSASTECCSAVLTATAVHTGAMPPCSSPEVTPDLASSIASSALAATGAVPRPLSLSQLSVIRV